MKNLPIQIVATRGEQDLFWKEGMGNNTCLNGLRKRLLLLTLA